MKILKESIAFILIFIVLLRDQFSDMTIWQSIPSTPFYIVIVIALIICFYPEKKISLIQNFWMQLRVIVFILALIILIPMFGGKSAVGLKPTEPIFIIVLIVSVFQLRMQYKRAKQQVAREKEIEEQLKKTKK